MKHLTLLLFLAGCCKEPAPTILFDMECEARADALEKNCWNITGDIQAGPSECQRMLTIEKINVAALNTRLDNCECDNR